MKRGRPLGMPNGASNLLESDMAILNALCQGSATFTRLQQLTRASSSTLWSRLKFLEEKGYIERSPIDRRVYCLSSKVGNWLWKTLIGLSMSAHPVRLDIVRGLRIFDEDRERIKNALMIVSTLGLRKDPITGWVKEVEPLPDCPHSPLFICARDKDAPLKSKVPGARGIFPFELNQVWLITALARYNAELEIEEWLDSGVDSRKMSEILHTEESEMLHILIFRKDLHIEHLQRVYKALQERKEEDFPVLFPVLATVRKMEVESKFLELLDWLRPVVEGNLYMEIREEYRQKPDKDPEMRYLLFKSLSPMAFNLITEVFRTQMYYHKKMLASAWICWLEQKVKRDGARMNGENKSWGRADVAPH
jgi:DNA-binding Lrp family transcriptional regulator